METVWLTLAEVAELENKSYSGIKKDVLRGKIKAEKVETGQRCGFTYQVALSELSESAKIKYYAMRGEERGEEHDAVSGEEDSLEERGKEGVDFEQLTRKQREKAFVWQECIQIWRRYVAQYEGREEEATAAFIREYQTDLRLSRRTLYRKWKDYKEHGLAGLADLRGKRTTGKKREVDERLKRLFEDWYLDENEPSVRYCYQNLRRYAQMEMPGIAVPSESTFYRIAEDIPLSVRKYFRQGERVFENEVAPYVKRRYDFLSNEYWSADYHTLDLMVREDVTGRVFRPHVVTWIDVRSRKILSLRLSESSNSDQVILAFKDAVTRFGIPENVYLDNGREFLVHDFGGRGTRKTDASATRGTNILDRFGIKMVNAKVKNSKAKVIERSYRVLSEQFSKMYLSFCGNNPVNRPERHGKLMKKEENIPLLSEVTKNLRLYVEGIYNEEISQAEGLNGKSPNGCYEENLASKKMAPLELIQLHLLRSSTLRTFGRNGVTLTFGETKMQFYNPDLVEELFMKKVYVHYDPEDLRRVKLYDENEVFVGEAMQKSEGGYQILEDTEAIKENNAAVKALRKRSKAYKEDMKDHPKLLDVVSRVSSEKIKALKGMDVKVLKMASLPYTQEQKVSGDATLVDFDRMIRSLKKQKGE